MPLSSYLSDMSPLHRSWKRKQKSTSQSGKHDLPSGPLYTSCATNQYVTTLHIYWNRFGHIDRGTYYGDLVPRLLGICAKAILAGLGTRSLLRHRCSKGTSCINRLQANLAIRNPTYGKPCYTEAPRRIVSAHNYFALAIVKKGL